MKASFVIPALEKFVLIDGFPIVVDLKNSHGSWIVDLQSGKEYLDCFGQFSSQALGWNHPALVSKKNEFAEIALTKLANSDIYSIVYANFVNALSKTSDRFQNLFFISGGALAVENALKAAFDWKAQKIGIENPTNLDVIHFKNSFHGRSGYTLSLTNTDPIKTKEFPKFNWSRVTADNEGLDNLEKNWPENVAAIIVEPIQAEGGDIHLKKDFLQRLRCIADKHECLLIFDEVQTGLTTGSYWAFQHFDVLPDIIAFAKKTQVGGIANLTDKLKEVPNVFQVSGRINSTFGGDTVDFLRATIILETIEKENLLENSSVVGEYFLLKLRELGLENVRGKGFMIAFDHPDRDAIINKLKEKMLCLKCGKKSIRFRPHLTFSREDVDTAIGFIKEVI